MSETKFTPGPWTTEFEETYSVRAGSGYSTRVAIVTNLRGRHGMGGRLHPEEVAANAYLMASAPDLYEALLIAKDIINRYANNNKKIAGYSSIEDALAKARGEV